MCCYTGKIMINWIPTTITIMTTWVNLASLYIVILCISIFHPCHGCEYSWISASPLPPSSSSSTSSPSSPWLWQPGWIWPPCNAREYPANERLCSQALWPWVACKNYFQKKICKNRTKLHLNLLLNTTTIYVPVRLGIPWTVIWRFP